MMGERPPDRGLPGSFLRHHQPDLAESVILLSVATVGIVGNCGIILAVLLVPKLRQPSNAFLFHQCLLDLAKSVYCIPFSQSLIGTESVSYCNLMGASYIVLVTSSSFNLLAMVMNEAYQFTDLMLKLTESRNYCCVVFGVFTVWFSSVIMNLGVAFIPGNTSYDWERGMCILLYGITRNYVMHLLWVILVTMALGCTGTYLWKLYQDIRKISYYRLTTLIRATVSIDPELTTPSLRQEHERKQKHHIRWVQHHATKKLFLLILVTSMFTVFWYPLFILTLVDPRVEVPQTTYKALTIFAWSNPTITPIVMFFFIKTTCCCQEQQPLPDSHYHLDDVHASCPESDSLMCPEATVTNLWIDHVADNVHPAPPGRYKSSTGKGKKNVSWQSQPHLSTEHDV